MSKNQYKNISFQSIAIIGVGTVEPGEVIETEVVVENPNLEVVEKGKQGKSVSKEDGDGE